MSNKQAVICQCQRENKSRGVYQGKTKRRTFLKNMEGSLLLSGIGSCRAELLLELTQHFVGMTDSPVIFLTSRAEMLEALLYAGNVGDVQGVMASFAGHKNYHPMYGFGSQQVCEMVRITAETLGCTSLMDELILYTTAITNIVSRYYPPSLPAISQLLKSDDDYIAKIAANSHLTNVIVDNILGSYQAGIMLRRVVEKLEETFSEVAEPGSETKYNFQSGAKRGVPVMAFYQPCREQALMNVYLKEEIYNVLQCIPKVRIIADEILFVSRKDELLSYLLDLKRQRKIDLVICSENANEMLQRDMVEFSNVCLFPHATKTGFDDISKAMFGTYMHHYPVLSKGSPASVLFTFKKDEHWTVATEERLKVRAEDLYGNRNWKGEYREQAVIKKYNDPNIYMVPVENIRGKENRNYGLSLH